MSSEAFFQASQDGDAGKVREQIEEEKVADVNVKDEAGMSALAHAASKGHTEVVEELLSRGANRTEVVEAGHGKENEEVIKLLESHHQPMAMPVDMHGGHQLPDGTVSYVDYPQGYPMMGQEYYYDPAQQMDVPGPNQEGRPRRQSQQHSRNDSQANLPPPEIARMIPCRYFPNCSYGDKCIFAHPVPPMSPSTAHASMPQQGPAPMLYQPPPAYGYAPYGPPQFYPMGPPVHYSHPPMPVHFQPQPPPQQMPPQSVAEPFVPLSQEPSSSSSSSPASEKINGVVSTPPQQDGGAPLASPQVQDQDDEHTQVDAQGRPLRRRQSFNSFLHHHAVPFQPAGDAYQQQLHPVPHSGQTIPKNARRAFGQSRPLSKGASERPPCTFFAMGRCKRNDECLFPHILPDGTDARPLQAQQRQLYAAQLEGSRKVNGIKQPPNGPAYMQQLATNTTAPASAPTGPQAAKKAAEQGQPQSQSQFQSQPQSEAQPQQQSQQSPSEALSQSNTQNMSQTQTQPESQSKFETPTEPNSMNGQPSASSSKSLSNGAPSAPSKPSGGPVRSNPSKTSTQAQAAAANKASGSTKKSTQRLPTVNDFPALPISLPGIPGSQSIPLAPAVENGAAVNGSVPAKANFSAILSAPAPPRPQPPSPSLAPNPADGEDEVKQSTSQDKEVQGHTQKDKEKPKPQNKSNGSKKKELRSAKSSASSEQKSASTPPPASDDDFQVVKGKNSNKRQGQGDHAGSYAAQAKAVAA